MEYVDLKLLKRHLNVEESYTDDDAYIELLADVAEEKVGREVCVPLGEVAEQYGGALPSPLKMAILLTVGGYYENREEITAVQTRPLTQGAMHLINLYRDYTR